MCTAPEFVDAGGPDGNQIAIAIAAKSRSEGPKRESQDRLCQGEPWSKRASSTDRALLSCRGRNERNPPDDRFRHMEIPPITQVEFERSSFAGGT
jgi:hypothetical protein